MWELEVINFERERMGLHRVRSGSVRPTGSGTPILWLISRV